MADHWAQADEAIEIVAKEIGDHRGFQYTDGDREDAVYTAVNAYMRYLDSCIPTAPRRPAADGEGAMSDRISEIRARVEATATGPWEWDTGKREGITPRHDRMSQDRFFAFQLVNAARWVLTPHELVFDGFDEEDTGTTSSALPVVVMAEGDAAFIEHSRTDVPYLLDELAASQAHIERLTAALESLHRNVGIFNEAEMAGAIRAALDGASTAASQGAASQSEEGK